MKFLVTQQEDGKFSFNLTDNEASFVLSSILFNDRDACIEAIRGLTQVLPNRANYQVVSNEGQSNFNVLVAGQTVASSPNFADDASASDAADALSEDTSDEPQYSVEVHTFSTETTNVKREQVVLPSLNEIDFDSLYDLDYASPTGKAGFESFNREDKNAHYFHFNDENGKALLFSKGFDTNAKKEKRIRQVIAASEKVQRYEIKEEGGAFYFILKERNNLEIVRSRKFTTREEAETQLQFVQTNAPTYASEHPEPTKRKSVNHYNFDIKPLSANAGFDSIKGEDKQNYFVVKDDSGLPVLFSQSYGSGNARDNGIKTVIKNSIEETRYEKSDQNGKFSFILRAGNRQEIAKSPDFETIEQRDTALAWLLANARSYAEQYGVVYETQKIVTENTESFTIDMPTPISGEANSETKTNTNMQIDSYLPCESYAGHTESPAEDFRIFQNPENKEHYFTMLSKSGKVVFRSEGYPTTAARDNGIASVTKNRELRERYSVVEDGGKYFLILKAGNHQEIARSCPFDIQDELFGLYPFMVAGSTAAISFDDTVSDNSSDREIDDYLPCDAYKGHEESPAEGIRTFQNEKDGEYYFSVVNNDGDVIMRSEGYPTKGARDNGVASVIKNREIKERYAEIEEDGLHYIILKAGNHQEIARSCPSKDKAGLWALFPILGLGLAGLGFGASAGTGEIAGASALATEVEKESEGIGAGVIGAGLAGAAALAGGLSGDADAKIEDIKKDNDGIGAGVIGAGLAGAAALGASALMPDADAKVLPVVETPKVAPLAMADGDIDGAVAGGGLPKWLLPILGIALLGALLWWLMRGCQKEPVAATTEVPAMVDSSAVTTDTVKVAATPAPVGEQMEGFAPVVLYFDNDQPNKNSKAESTQLTYTQTFEKYMRLKNTFAKEQDTPEAKTAVEGFFDNNVKKGYEDLKALTAKIAEAVQKGEKVTITVKGFASPLAQNDYNINLTKRRVSSIQNYLESYEDGILKKHMDKISITQQANGEDSSVSGLSDDNKNVKLSVYDLAPSKERRVEIVDVRFVKE
ncbi:OmpA family protein [Arcicella aurantiaca]|uniref:OmpA family protein n=1 Tax=Arcicella aurantiaca TaxID=591202 RepID=A0A316EA99_9BACT|nr:DUF1508 domain-containing protein [Arcicella aurantiaca]PWK26923.1 OmpA family protein [Arcicella aurantiaca]